jgi:uncharacterized protein YfaS (alpha-2-macroglobulin family)
VSGDAISSIVISDSVSDVTAKNTGTGVGYVSWVADGVPLNKAGADEEDLGLSVGVEYRDAYGVSLDVSPTLSRGQRVIADITLTPFASIANNIVISLPMAGGLEIENPKLSDSPTEEEEEYGVRVERRDDRLLLFVDKLEKTFRWTFSMRAVTPGQFILPPIAAEGMYSPGARSTGRTSSVTIVSR